MTRKLIIAACVLLAACASSESTDTTVAATDAATETTAAAAGGGGAAATITMSEFTFSGPSTVQMGETIELVNQDGVPHTFTSEDEETFDVSIPGGETATYTFEEAGEYSYFCTIHPSMTGTITVEG